MLLRPGEGCREGASMYVNNSHGSNDRIIALILRDDFPHAKILMRHLDAYVDYDDWLDEQEGIQIGYSMAGLDAKIVIISVVSFLEWCDRCQIRPSEQNLVSFAETIAICDTAEKTPPVASPL
jgi:hypothetical protein